MRLMKSLPYAISALALAAGTAFAGQDSAWLSEQYAGPQSDESFSAGLSGSESMSMSSGSDSMDVVYIFPVEVTEYWVLAPSESASEMPG